MKIAVTYENGEIFQHFGHCEKFKIYTVEQDEVISSEVVDSTASGHGAISQMLSDYGVNAVICGGLGDGAMNALTELGIEVCSGVSGDCDEAVGYYIKGELESTGVNCDHHSHEESEGCGCGTDAGSCGCGGGCGGGCGHHAPSFEGPNVGKTVRVHYRGTLNDGTQFDSSYDRGEPLEFVCGAGMMIKGFDKAVATMNVGEKVNVHLMPEEAYGPRDPQAIITVPIAELPGAEDLAVGDGVYLTNMYGQQFPVTVVAKVEDIITFDANHEMAGKELNFEIELVEIL